MGFLYKLERPTIVLFVAWIIVLFSIMGAYMYYTYLEEKISLYPVYPAVEEKPVFHDTSIEYQVIFKLECPPNGRITRNTTSIWFNYSDKHASLFLSLLRDEVLEQCTKDTCIKLYLKRYRLSFKQDGDQYYILMVRLSFRNETWVYKDGTLWLNSTSHKTVIIFSDRTKLNTNTVKLVCPELNDKKYTPLVWIVNYPFIDSINIPVEVHTYRPSQYLHQLNRALMVMLAVTGAFGFVGFSLADERPKEKAGSQSK